MDKRFIMKVGGQDVDVTDIPALTIGDRKALKAAGVDFLKYARSQQLDPEDEAKMLLHLLKKRRSETTLEEVDEIPAMISSSFLGYFMRRSAEVDDPFSTRSTSSETPTGGASAKSELSVSVSS